MARRSVSEFLRGFVVPLVAGGDVHVGAPVDSDDMQAFEEDLVHASVELVTADDARTQVLAELVVRPPALVLDVDELELAAALHNVLFLVHPTADDWSVSNRKRKRVAEAATQFASRPIYTDRTRVLARHGLLHNLFDLTRRDVTVSWWTGRATFLGQSPPRRLTRWRRLRRVREETDVVDFEGLLTSPEVAPIVAALLRRSPLTQLLSASRPGPLVHWEDAAFLLRDAELARVVSFVALSPAEPHSQVAAPARLAAAFEQMLERRPEGADVRAVAAFLVHLNALLAVAESAGPRDSGRSPLLTAVLAPERAGQRPRGLSAFFALPNALAKVEPKLAMPPGVSEDTRVYRRWQSHRNQVRECVGAAVIDTLAGRVARHLQHPSPPVEVGDNSG